MQASRDTGLVAEWKPGPLGIGVPVNKVGANLPEELRRIQGRLNDVLSDEMRVEMHL